MNPSLSWLLDRLVSNIKADPEFPEEFRSLPEDIMKAYLRKKLSEKIYDDIITEHTLQLTQVVVNLAKLQALQD